MNKSNLNQSNRLKIGILLILILFAFGFFSSSEYEPYDLTEEEYIGWWLDHYHELTCSYSMFEIEESFKLDANISLRNEPSGSVECFGKNFWVDYFPEQRIEDGWSSFKPKSFIIRISTNFHIDILLQSIIWLALLSLIPKTESYIFKNKYLSFLLITSMLYLHLVGEKAYYNDIGRDFSYLFFERQYDNSLSFNNYYLYSFVLSILIILFFLEKILASRMNNIINYFPFLFLVFGTYSSLNLNFYILLFSFLGLNNIYKKGINIKATAIYFLLSIVWFLNNNSADVNFDVDKIRGFTNTSQSNLSLIFWIIVIYLLINGLYNIFDEFKNFIDYQKLARNFLITSSLIFLIGNLVTLSNVVNFLTYYVLGLNKIGMNSLASVEGNTWRGIAPSAEGVGEFFVVAILFYIFGLITKRYKFEYLDTVLLLLTIAGLIRSNNASAMISMTLIVALFIIKQFVAKKNVRFFLYLLIFILIIFGIAFISDGYSFQFLSNIMLFEAVNASSIEYDFSLNQYNKSAVDEANYGLLLKLPEGKTNFSSSLKYLLNSYTYGNRIDNFPSAISLTSSVSYFINRSEKWGIFLSKYNPNLSELTFGYGPNQFSEYYLGHESIYMEGLILPHSSFLSILIFYGIFGLIISASILIRAFYKNRFDNFISYIMLFLAINMIKSDSILYLPNFTLLLSVFFIYTLHQKSDK